ncbi:MAG: undecaprenyl-phosphate glucose phosphotransferase [Gloeobacterales cyanobacterium]
MISQGQISLQHTYSLSTVLQRIIDPCLIVFLLYSLYSITWTPYQEAYVYLAIITFLLTPPLFRMAGLYRSYRTGSYMMELPRILAGWSVIIAVLLFLAYLTKSSSMFSRQVLITWFISVPFVIFLAHYLIRKVLHTEANNRTAVIVGATPLGRQLATEMVTSTGLGIKLIGFFDNNFSPSFTPLEAPILGKLEQLLDYVKRVRTNMVYIALPIEDSRYAYQIIESLRDTTASVYFMPDISAFDPLRLSVQSINGVPAYEIYETPFADGFARLAKRVSDIIISGIILLLISPLMAAIAILIKVTSPGPIFFKQRRYGLNGQEIVVYKFRSMTVTEDGDNVTQATRNDTRCTPLGKFLRRSSLDELPQFINVLQGHMSIVGPRPHAVAHNEQYRKLISGYMLRHKVKPGITGWAQVNGYRGETNNLDQMARRVEYDLHYMSNWSLTFDLEIIFKTLITVLHGRNAY